MSIGTHCQPCLAFHLGKARELGIGADEIQHAMEIGYLVETGAVRAMKQFVSQIVDQKQRLWTTDREIDSHPCCRDRKLMPTQVWRESYGDGQNGK